MTHDFWMREAIVLARVAAGRGEVPVGAVVVCGDRIIARGHNERESRQLPTAHAEMVAITRAAMHLNSWRLEECTLYVTLEPCPMCAGAILQARIPRVVYGADDPKAGAVTSLYELLSDSRLNHRCEVVKNILAEESAALLSEFFRKRRTQR
ncbi:MAG: tRNA adenosine(34) deaminase TadA [Thermoguttaceae bacterium]